MPYSVLFYVYPLFLIGLQYNLIISCSHQLLSIIHEFGLSISPRTFKIEVQQIIRFFIGSNP